MSRDRPNDRQPLPRSGHSGIADSGMAIGCSRPTAIADDSGDAKGVRLTKDSVIRSRKAYMGRAHGVLSGDQEKRTDEVR